MGSEFDKVIDALMRSSPLNGGTADRVSGDHLDADEIAAFAENLVPATARQNYILHFSDCGRCRSILSDVIALNADAVNASAPATSAAPAAVSAVNTVTPWYKRLFSMPNLAYGMGGLILVFSGLIGYTVINNMSENSSMVSQTSERSMPAYQTANTNAASTASASNAANAASNSSLEEQLMSANAAANAPARREYGFEPTQTPDAATYTQRLKENSDRAAASNTMPPPPPAPPVTAPMIEAMPMKDGEAKSANELEQADTATQQAPSANRQLPMLGRNNPAAKRKSEEAPRVLSAAPGGGTKRSVGGKSFEQRNGVWYDSAYDGRSTTNVRRGTQEYRNLDSGLRSIADNIRGSLVVVWKEKAYRID